MHISKRLKSIADMVDSNDRVIDIGCDHALLDIYLTLNNGNQCIASDISYNALLNARANIEKYHLISKIKTVVSDGVKGIVFDKVSTIIISGMGTNTIVNILKDIDKKYVNDIIVQSNNDLNILRREASKLGYYIIDEDVVLDKGIYYVVIKFKVGNKRYSSTDYEIGPILRSKECRIPYYDYLKKKNTNILNSIPKRYIKERHKLKKINRILK